MTETARCALHFDVDATGTCARCGRFGCPSCLDERSFCTECAPTARDPYGLNRSLNHFTATRLALQLLWAEFPKLLALTVGFAIPAALLQVVAVPDGDDLRTISKSIRLSNMYDLLVGTIGCQAMLALLIGRAEGTPLSLVNALREGVLNWRHALGARFRAYLWIVLFVLLLLLPGIWQGVMLMFVNTAALRLRNEDALEASRRVVKGHFWAAFGIFGINVVVMLITVATLMVVGAGLELAEAPRFVTELLSEAMTRLASDGVNGALFFVAFVMLHTDAGLKLAPMEWRHRQS